MKEKLLFIVVLILGFVLLMGSLTWLNGQLIQQVDAGEHFLVSWTRARAFMLSGESPYSESVTQEVQVALYGRFATAGEYAYLMDVPFYKLIAYFPFAAINDFELAFSLWMSFAELALLGVGILSVQLVEWKPSFIRAVLFYVAVLFSFFGLYPIIGGSGAVFTAGYLLLSLLFLREGGDEAVGILLLFGTLHPAKGGVLFLLLIGWIIYQRRWRVFAILGMSYVVVFVISFLLSPNWLSQYYEVLSMGLIQEYGFMLAEFLENWMPENSDLAAQVVRWIFTLILLVEWFNLRKGGYARLMWVSALSIVVVPFFAIPVSPYFFTLFLFPLPLLFKNIEDRWKKTGPWVSVLLMLLMLSTWFVFLRVENAVQILTFAYPAFLVIALYWMRWWSLRLPHTWADELKKYQQ